LMPCEAGAALTVQGVRHWTAPDHTRIVIDVSGSPKFRHSERTDPPRIVIEISKAKLHSSVRELAVSDGVIDRVRFNTLSGGLVQVVVDLPRRSEFNVFHLERLNGKPHRIVVDVTKPVAPQEPVPVGEPSLLPREKKYRVVVIDPGHGGEDPGAVSRTGLKEKDVCLKLARKLKEKLDAIPGIKAYLTRNGDYFLPLRKRTKIAKDLGADVFMSIHMNASRSRSAFGTEVFFLSLTGATDEAARELARFENSADLVGGVPLEAEEDIVSILTDLKQSNALARSSELAEEVIDSLGRHRKLVTRGVKQAGFTVLKSADFPCVLVEVAFISNNAEAALMKSNEFHDEVAGLLASALTRYCGAYATSGAGAAQSAK
ncbi:MAG: N-acetylmuramoyl-L-alanine amidase, partial [Candidatus Eisenbacteria bacterium]|nr:N-acetylmuramoyl-L-alanine amidase [Candidatus Eisenbacteria bacterium]